MNEQLLKIENILLESPQSYVFLTALGVFLGGLILWVGGLRYLKAVCGMLGGAVGAAVGSLLVGYLELPAGITIGISAAVFAIGAILLQQVLILGVATVIFALIFGGSFMEYTLGKQKSGELADQNNYESSQEEVYDQQTSWYEQQMQQERVSESKGYFDADSPYNSLNEFGQRAKEYNNTGEKLVRTGQYVGGVLDRIKQVLSELTPAISNNAGMLTMWCILGAILGLVLAQMLKTIVMALCCSIVGSTALIAGTIMAIIAKQTAAWSMIQGHGRTMTMVFVGMVVFGWLFQIVTGGGRKSRHENQDDDESSKE
ncbi:MAG: hypothetical protein JXM68_04110 [Sedimentisphaerales bacterium]|nr:hypothetical protein [Sedimentisphaerales bacterium]